MQREVDILIVEDDSDIRDALSQILEEEGYGVMGLPNGGEALAWLGVNAPPRVVLLDLMMPIMNGWEFRERQRQDPRLSAIPVVIVSADGTARRDSKAFDAAGFLLKPVDLDDLLSTVHRICRAPLAGSAPAVG